MDQFEIGTTLEGMTNVEQLTEALPAPRSTYQDYSALVQLGSGGMIGQGFPAATWVFGTLTTAQRDQLKTFCPGASATVYIKTKLGSEASGADEFAVFTAIMTWPFPEPGRTYSMRNNYVIEFTFLEAQESS